MSESLPEMREIRIFVAAYEERSFTAAAQREHATQSGVSQHIRRLEERLGTPLFIRRNSMEPTPEGTRYYAHCLETLRAYALASRSLDEFAGSLAGEAYVGISPTLAQCQLAPAYLRFCGQQPNASLKVLEAPGPVLVERVLEGELDFAIVLSAPPSDPRLTTTLFAQTPAVLVSSLWSGLEHGEPVRLSGLSGLKLTLPETGNWSTAVESYLDAERIDFQRLPLDAALGMLDLVRRTEWKAILPSLLMEHEAAAAAGDRDFTINPLSNPVLTLELHLVQLQDRKLSAMSTAFLLVLSEVIHESQQKLLSALGR